MPEKLEEDYERVISDFYGKDAVSAIVTLKVDTKEADMIASKVSGLDYIEDVFLVTGDVDIVAKAHFESYADLKKFVVGEIGQIHGIKDVKTLMVVSIYKNRGKREGEPEF